jgi:hypothetical protein
VCGEFSSGDCFLRGVYIGPNATNKGNGYFEIDCHGKVRIPESAKELREQMDSCAATIVSLLGPLGTFELPIRRVSFQGY